MLFTSFEFVAFLACVLVLYYLIYILCSHTRIRKEVWKNGWIWLLAISFVIADR